jgi:hypothetical protein
VKGIGEAHNQRDRRQCHDFENVLDKQFAKVAI